MNNQEVDEKVAHLTLMINDFKTRGQIASFVRAACQQRGPFASTIQGLQHGNKIAEKKRFQTASV